VLSNAGDHVPEIPLLDIIGKAGIFAPLQYGPYELKLGITRPVPVTSH
jgi:hypothetical protein